jgi:hypothetical protein
MPDLHPSLESHREAVDAFLRTAREVPAGRWAEPRASGKWSPGQVVEHVARAYEVNRAVLHGRASMSAPRWLRPLIRKFLLMPVLRHGRFIPGSKSPGVFRPGPSPAPPAELIGRLAAAAAAFESDAAALGTDTLDHPFFGRLALGDFVRLQEIHARHHRLQLEPAAGTE